MRQSGNTIVITGAGSGIGRELARRFHALGHTVIVAGRRPEPLRETIGDRDGMHALLLDVADPASIAAFARPHRRRPRSASWRRPGMWRCMRRWY